MPNEFLPYLWVLAAYAIGSISTAILTCKIMGLPDPRTVGSKNPGATNVLRHGGKKAAFFTLSGDVLKGLVPVLIARQLGLDSFWVMLTGLAAFLGHVYPAYFRFRGGKGVATAIGAYVGIHWLAGLLAIAIWLVIAKVVKISSLAALIANFTAPLIFYLVTHNLSITLGITVIVLVIFWRHRSNIKNMIEGTEHRIGPKQ